MLRVLLYLLIIAAVIYAVFWSINRRNADPGSQSSAPDPRPRGPLGPDDDEDFLRELDRKRKHRPEE
ncbi:hypothetical protein [Nocardioides mangrovicus]|uniref:hypothetical protein n=1 Tax=Nocardioides mangrovicus TaxID=2478913 RepID=UPI0018E082C9|nr:hypothetical protein [Nocardioides mangrovicus]